MTKLLALILFFFSLLFSCNFLATESGLNRKSRDRILISSVKTETSSAKFREIVDPKIIAKYFDLLVDTIEFNSLGPREYDHRIQFYQQGEIVEEVYVFESGNSFSFWGTENFSGGQVLNPYWNQLDSAAQPLDSRLHQISDVDVAEKFYNIAKATNAYVSVPSFCDWQKYDGELYICTDIIGEPIRLDSLEALIKSEYPEYEFDVQSMDIVLGKYQDPKRVRILSSNEFFKEFQFRGRSFEELKFSDSAKANWLRNIKQDYTVTGLRTPIIRNGIDVLKQLNNGEAQELENNEEEMVEDFDFFSQEYYSLYVPLIEVVGDSAAIKELDAILADIRSQK